MAEVTFLFEVDMGYKTQKILMRGPATIEEAKAVFERQQRETNRHNQPIMPRGEYSVRVAKPEDFVPPPDELTELKADLDALADV